MPTSEVLSVWDRSLPSPGSDIHNIFIEILDWTVSALEIAETKDANKQTMHLTTLAMPLQV